MGTHGKVPFGYEPGPVPGSWVLSTATVTIECAGCRQERSVAIYGTSVAACPRCGRFEIYQPQQALPLDWDRTQARQRAQSALLIWPPIATFDDWRMRNG